MKRILWMGLCLGWACQAWAREPLRINSLWQASPAHLQGNARAWISLPEASQQNLAIQASNDGQSLILVLATRSRRVKTQLLGAYHQSLTLWFETGPGEQPTRRGLRLSFHHLPGAGYPRDDSEEPDYWQASTHEIAELAPGMENYPRILIPKSKDLELITDMDHGQLTYVLKLPLHSDTGHAWSLEAQAGQSLRLRLETSPIEAEAAFIELVREYEQEVQGWGWEQKGYGPRQELKENRAYGLGDYDNWGLDQSIYATHGLYNHLSWGSIPSRLEFDASLQLAVPASGN